MSFPLLPFLFPAYKFFTEFKKEFKIRQLSLQFKKINNHKSRIYIPLNKEYEIYIETINSFEIDENYKRLKALEKENRTNAYASRLSKELNQEVIIDDSFSDDSDLVGDFSLHVMYLKSKQSDYEKLIYSVRTFEDYRDIKTELNGIDGIHVFNQQNQEYTLQSEVDNTILIDTTENICIDRFSLTHERRTLSTLFKHNFCLNSLKGYLFRHVINIANPDAVNIYALARSSQLNELRSNYVRLGMEVIGYNFYTIAKQSYKHHCLKGNLKKMEKNLANVYKITGAALNK